MVLYLGLCFEAQLDHTTPRYAMPRHAVQCNATNLLIDLLTPLARRQRQDRYVYPVITTSLEPRT